MTYFVTAVKKDSNNEIINLMYFHNPSSDKIEPPIKFYSSEIDLVIEFINDMKVEFKTAYFEENVLIAGSKIIVQDSGKRKYLKTLSNKEDKDNLDNLPTF